MRDFQWTGFERIFPSLPGLQVLVPALSVTRRPDYLRPWLAGLGGEIPWHVVPDMVELPAVRPQASSATPIFLHLAAVSTFKGHADLLDAATRLDAAGQPVRIDSHGHVAHRRHRKRLAARITREGLGRHVRLAPQLQDPAPAIATSRAVLVTTRSYPGGPETFGRTIIEAWAHARPVIAYACGGPAELVDDGVDGFLVEEGNVAALAAAIARLAANPVLADRLGRAGLEKVRRRFAAAAVTRQLVDRLRGEMSEVASHCPQG
jgi:Glycosyltransferase